MTTRDLNKIHCPRSFGYYERRKSVLLRMDGSDSDQVQEKVQVNGDINKNMQDIGLITNQIPDTIARSLDMAPVIGAVAKHTGTKRGHDALMSLLEIDRSESGSSTQRLKSRITPRNLPKARPYPVTLTGVTNTILSVTSSRTAKNDYFAYQNWHRSRNTNHIIKLSQSAHEAKNEWILIEEAMEIIRFHTSSSNNLKSPAPALSSFPFPSLPPIYPADFSPMDAGSCNVATDDDEWLIDILSKSMNESLELEDILKAEQILNRIISTYSWAAEKYDSKVIAAISKLRSSVNISRLTEVFEEIKNSIIIVKGQKTFEDPRGTKVSLFCAKYVNKYSDN